MKHTTERYTYKTKQIYIQQGQSRWQTQRMMYLGRTTVQSQLIKLHKTEYIRLKLKIIKSTHPFYPLPLWEKAYIPSSATVRIFCLFTSNIDLHIAPARKTFFYDNCK